MVRVKFTPKEGLSDGLFSSKETIIEKQDKKKSGAERKL